MGKRIYDTGNKRLYQLKPGGNYYVRLGGNEVCLETKDIDQANENLKLQDALNSRFGTKAFKFRLRQLFPNFLKDKKKETRANTYASYERIWLTQFEPTIGKLYVADVNQRSWQKFCDKFDSISDFQNQRNLLHQFLVWCEMKEFTMAVPTLKNPKHKRRKRKIIPPNHLALIFQFAGGSLLLFLAFALFMGMRRSEIIKLTWKRIDLVARTILLDDADVKTDEGREIPMSEAVYKLLLLRLHEQQAAGSKTPWIFPNALNSRRHADVSGLKTAWKTCLKRCDLTGQYTWHDFRATFEKHAHKSKDHTETQKEKMVGADIDVQKRIYVSMNADDLRGLEEVVQKQVPELVQIIDQKTNASKVQVGPDVENKNLKLFNNGVSSDDR